MIEWASRARHGFGFADLADIETGIGGPVGGAVEGVAHVGISGFELGAAVETDTDLAGSRRGRNVQDRGRSAAPQTLPRRSTPAANSPTVSSDGEKCFMPEAGSSR
jgi:hypothetical protein